MGSGRTAKEKVKAAKSGKMAPSMKATGPTTWPTAKAGSFKQAVTSMKESGSMTRPKEKVSISTRTELLIPENGITISNMVTVMKNGRMALNMKGTISKG